MIILIVVTAIAAGALLIAFSATNLKRLEVVVLPEQAASSAQIELVEGKSIAINSTVWSIDSNAKLKVSADGYETEELAISEAAWERSRIDIILRERLARLTAASIPAMSDTLWYLNNNLVAQGGSLRRNLESGDYLVEARHPYFAVAKKELTVEAGMQYDLEFELQQVQGILTIASIPDKASVTIDSVPVGKTPIDVRVVGGERKILVAYEGFDTVSDTVKITSRSNQVQRAYELVPAKVPISFRFTPGGGAIVLNGRSAPELASSNALLNINSTNRIRYSKAGYATKNVEFVASAARREPVVVELEPILGVVDIRTSPANANVELGGKVVGQTPLRLRLHAVEQTISIALKGYVGVMRKLTPDPNKSQEILINLETLKEHRIATAAPTYRNSAGIEMKLFDQPDTFIMGSQRGEVGRRANEFLREIKLVKPFYAGIYEVTEEQFSQFSSPQAARVPNRMPVKGIEWAAAAKFCNWLSDKEEFEKVYNFVNGQFRGSNADADGYRMLTEAEWEWLARKKGRAQQSKYPWGNIDKPSEFQGNLADASASGILPFVFAGYNDNSPGVNEVGSYPPNAAGIYDLAGNVSEWTHDSYSLQSPQAGVVEIDPFDTTNGKHRTLKGSNWKTGRLDELRGAWREGGQSAKDTAGFRVARYLYGGT